MDGRCGATVALIATLLAAPLAAPVAAQTVEGRVVAADGGLPIAGALVLLVDRDGAEPAGALSLADGRFVLRAPGPGRYTVRAERIGYGPASAGPLELGTGQSVSVTLAMPVLPVTLAEIEVAGEQRCVLRPEEGLELARVWEEARKALAAQQWTAREQMHRYRVSLFRRRLNGDGTRVLSEDREQEEVRDAVPFSSLPAATLLDEGFIREYPSPAAANRRGLEYLAPDAGVLLSDLFLDRHCFRLTESDTLPRLLGLAFEPLQERGRRADIRGVLWLDRESTELEFLDFRYTWNPISRSKNLSGGRVAFERLPGGAWIVSEWVIRMPTRRGYEENGAETLASIDVGAVAARLGPTAYGDTTAVTRSIRDAVRKRQLQVMRSFQVDPGVMAAAAACSPDLGHACWGVDPDDVPCLADVDCTPLGVDYGMADSIVTAARQRPDAGFLVGYAVYSRMKSGQPDEALELARGCRAAGWWCDLLEGYAHQGAGQVIEGDARLRAGLAAAPDSIRCLLTEASWVLPTLERDRMQAQPCEARLAASDSIWWLADPLWAAPGNDRRAAHVTRTLGTRFLYFEVRDSHLDEPLAGRLRELRLSWRIPRGTWDSWLWLEEPAPSGYHFEPFTSQTAARYHFVPDFEDGELSRPVWRLDATLDDEGYTPAYGSFHQLPVQIARFRRGDSMMVAVAGTVAGSPLEAPSEAAEPSEATAHLILSDGPGRFPVELASALHEDRAVFLARTPVQRYMASFEVLSPGVYGRHRVVLEALEVLERDAAGLSDVLLYQPRGNHDPDSLVIAAGMMRGTTVLEQGEQPGFYWETYGARADTEVTMELEIEREGGGGFFSRIGRLFGGGGGGRGKWSWTEASPGAVFAKAVTLEVGDLDRGEYTLVLRASWAGQETVETRRVFEVR